ncbi:MAG TPA: shikimate dehydrogenase [Stellaceae bacterium]|jgi:shikimate dehydrogenase|nr:shikimate dehydrogenase [Stellaceae bacterium]
MSDDYRVAGVMGWPVAHSRSPAMHRYWLERHGLAGDYVKLAVPPKNLARALRALPDLGFAGCNLTIPHKEAALDLVDAVDDQARAIGAVNTIIVRPHGMLQGFNSDAFGFIENLKAEAPQWRAAAGPAVVLGAGGAARAVVAALLDHGVDELRLVNRHRERAEQLASAYDGRVRVWDWEQRAAALAGGRLLVNTTSLGMHGTAPLDLPLADLPADAVVNDIVYTPLETPLLAAARKRGNPTVDGIGMLLHQGRPGFAGWFGIRPEVTPELRARVIATLGPA